VLVFFFQAEDGIRDDLVTGVQTCALPILCLRRQERHHRQVAQRPHLAGQPHVRWRPDAGEHTTLLWTPWRQKFEPLYHADATGRSEERRVGNEWRAR